ncbi:YchJ family protein [Paramicrobacterium fandaimingii]|uniref:YchJ family protein n=1 Tax=Paramicrobacterium fandaimingii TaxID=2708079 RepID=UPI001421716D|nr:YchJ family protein [Microbacterium fandaimingii]
MYAVVDDNDRCPCGSGDIFSGCCGPALSGGKPAPTAVQLMRSRFTAFVLGNTEHLLRTWHSTTRPSTLTLDAGIVWTRLDIFEVRAGGPFDEEGTVHFVAQYRSADGRGRQEEKSTFVRENGSWYYVDGESSAS